MLLEAAKGVDDGVDDKNADDKSTLMAEVPVIDGDVTEQVLKTFERCSAGDTDVNETPGLNTSLFPDDVRDES